MNELIGSASACFKSGKFRDAELICYKVLEQDPNCVPALMQLSYSVAALSRKEEALELTDRILSIDSAFVEALVWRSNLLRGMGRLADATLCARQAVDLAPDYATGHFALGLCSMAAKRLEAASKFFEQAISLNPQIANYHYHLGLVLDRSNRFSDAERSYAKSVDLAPNEPNYLVNMGQFYKRNGLIEAAVDCFARALNLKGSVAGYIEIADLYVKLGNYVDAERSLRSALALDKNMAVVHELLAMVMEETGRFTEAAKSLTCAYDLEPGKTSLLYRIARSKHITENDLPFVTRLEALRKAPGMKEEQIRYLDYALGKAHDDLSQFATAIQYFDEANALSERLQFAGKKYPLKEFRSTFASVKQRFTRDFFQRNQKLIGSESDQPIFVVGMLRSGTTLVEQILSCHPQVVAGGEIPFWLDPPAKSALHHALSGQLDKVALDKLVHEYLGKLQSITLDRKHVVDKMPNNYMALGLVHLLFPNARIIHCRRNPVDNCLSIYTTLYSDAPKFAYNRENIVEAYRLYADLMAHWSEVIPCDRLLTVDYEGLVSDHENVTRQVVEFLGLDWDASCLRHEMNPRAVKTPSLWQVRQPIYGSSVERWKNYEPWLGAFGRLSGGV